MSYMAGDYGGGYAAGDYMAGGIFSSIGGLLKKGLGAAMSIAGGPMGRIAAARLNLPAHGSNPSNLPAVIPNVGETALQGFVRRGGHLTTGGRMKAMAERNAALQPKIMAPEHMMGLGRRRRMNWANSKALGRAERRIHSAVKHMTKYIRWVHPTKAGHAVPRFGRHKKK